MSFMSFDYAMRAAEAQLQFHEGQGRNMKDANERVAQVGVQHANSKDKLVRDKIQAEYEARTAEVDAKLKDDLLALAEEKKQNSLIAAAAVTIGQVVGGWADHALGIQEVTPAAKGVPDSEQGGGWWDRGSDISVSGETTAAQYQEQKDQFKIEYTKEYEKLKTELKTSPDNLKLQNNALSETMKDNFAVGGTSSIDFGDGTKFNCEKLSKDSFKVTLPGGTPQTMTAAQMKSMIEGNDAKLAPLTKIEAKISAVDAVLANPYSLTNVVDLGNSNLSVSAYNASTNDFMLVKINKESGASNVGAVISPSQMAKITTDYLTDPKQSPVGGFKRNAEGDIVMPKDSPYSKLFVQEHKDGKPVFDSDGNPVLKKPPEFSGDAMGVGKVSSTATDLISMTMRSQVGIDAQREYLRQNNETYTTSDAANDKIGGPVNKNAFSITPAYHAFAEKACALVRTDGVRAQLGKLEPSPMTPDQIEKLTGTTFTDGTMFNKLQDAGTVTSTWDDFSSGTKTVAKAIFKPIFNAMQSFIELGKVYKEYSEEVDQANAQANAAKRKAQVAKERLLQIEAALVAGN